MWDCGVGYCTSQNNVTSLPVADAVATVTSGLETSQQCRRMLIVSGQDGSDRRPPMRCRSTRTATVVMTRRLHQLVRHHQSSRLQRWPSLYPTCRPLPTAATVPATPGIDLDNCFLYRQPFVLCFTNLFYYFPLFFLNFWSRAVD